MCVFSSSHCFNAVSQSFQVPLSTPKDTCTPPSSPKKKKARKSDEILPGQAGVPAGEGLEDERPVTLRHDFGDSANPTTESDSEAGKETVDDTTSDRDSNKTGEGKEAE
jgi:hypothetical protein